VNSCLLYWNTVKSECLPLLSSSPRKSVWSASPWQCLAAHKCVHHRCHQRFWMESIATSTLKSQLFIHRILHVWSFRKKLGMLPLCQWWGTAECNLSVAAEDGEQLVWGGNTCSCSKVEEDCWQRLRLHWKVAVPWAVLSSSVHFYHVQLVNSMK
jgi:hypothetical protein